MRTLTYYIACSADGFIARDNGAIDDFSFEGEHVADLLHEYPETIPTHLRQYFDLATVNKHFDTVLMGRRTYEAGLSIGITCPYQHLEQYVFSKTLADSPDPKVTLISSNVIEEVRTLKAQQGLGIWLCGGSVLASALFGEIDQIIIKSNPFLMGKGMALFAHELPKTELQLVNHRTYANGFSLLHYAIRHQNMEND